MSARRFLKVTLSALAGLAAIHAHSACATDAKLGARLVAEHCATCHGVDGNSPVPGTPHLAAQQPDYLLAELRAYREGKRESPVMQPIAQALADADAGHIAAFLIQQKPAPRRVTAPDQLALGKRVYFEGNPDSGVPSCDGCHETGGEGADRFPRVAGQDVDYTLEQFRLYAAGKRNYGKKVMRTVAQRLTAQEARAVAEYMASQP
ncbi:MAG: c-type cytochrome [Pseudomonadota bacterium]